MTKSEIATYVTTKLSDTDSATVAFAKLCIDRRYDMIWSAALWTETIGIASSAVSASATSVTISDVPTVTFFHSVSPPTTFIDFPIAVRMTETGQTEGIELPGQDWATFFAVDPNSWNTDSSRLSTPQGFINLPKDGSGYCRLRLVPTPATAGTLFTLGKLKIATLGDSDTPCLRGIDNALIAFVEGDLLERGRQYAKAQAKFTEAAAHLSIMKDVEKGQMQNTSRIVPDDDGGTGDPTGGPQ